MVAIHETKELLELWSPVKKLQKHSGKPQE